MIGFLPRSLIISNVEYAINTDYRIALLIFEAFDDPDLSEREKTTVLINCLFEKPETIPFNNFQEALQKAAWFLDGGKIYEDKQQTSKKIISWSQDEQMVFAAINKVANCELRAIDYVHWWTFLGYFSEIGECLLNTVVSIRKKKNEGKKLDKTEREFYQKNKSLVDIKKKYSKTEQAERDRINAILG